jgi:hypothetical protein
VHVPVWVVTTAGIVMREHLASMFVSTVSLIYMVFTVKVLVVGMSIPTLMTGKMEDNDPIYVRGAAP